MLAELLHLVSDNSLVTVGVLTTVQITEIEILVLSDCVGATLPWKQDSGDLGNREQDTAILSALVYYSEVHHKFRFNQHQELIQYVLRYSSCNKSFAAYISSRRGDFPGKSQNSLLQCNSAMQLSVHEVGICQH